METEKGARKMSQDFKEWSKAHFQYSALNRRQIHQKSVLYPHILSHSLLFFYTISSLFFISPNKNVSLFFSFLFFTLSFHLSTLNQGCKSCINPESIYLLNIGWFK